MTATWQELKLRLSADRHDAAQELLHSAGAVAVTTTARDNEELFEPRPGQTPLWRNLEMAALFPPRQDLSALSALLKTAGIELSAPAVIQGDWWQHGNRWQAARYGRRLWICPAGTAPDSPDDAVVVALDPGLAFGTGSHPTTRLCLEWLDAHPPQGREVVDYGCGSGILAIAAVKLGARRVQAIDIDPQALAATRRNAERNAVSACIEPSPGDRAPRPGDLLIANILKQPLLQLIDRFTGCLRPGGDLVLSGLLASQVPEVQRSYAAAVDWKSATSRDGWVLVHGVRRNRANHE